MKVLNLMGSPGAKKSTLAAYIFAMLKMQVINVELVTEYAKELTWEEDFITLSNQEIVLKEQYRRQKRLVDKVDLCITDSPLLLSKYYGNGSVDTLVDKYNSEFENYYLFVERVLPYIQIGRTQTKEESDSISKELLTLMDSEGIIYPITDIIHKDVIVGDLTRYYKVGTYTVCEECEKHKKGWFDLICIGEVCKC